MAIKKEIKIYLRMSQSDELAKQFLAVKEHLRLKNDTEVIRSLINWYWRQHKEDLEPALEHYNLDEKGVMILDRTVHPNRIIEVYFKPNGVFCEYCGTNRCRHTEFALNIPKVQEILREKGWKIE